jgi:hypothetical protein
MHPMTTAYYLHGVRTELYFEFRTPFTPSTCIRVYKVQILEYDTYRRSTVRSLGSTEVFGIPMSTNVYEILCVLSIFIFRTLLKAENGNAVIFSPMKSFGVTCSSPCSQDTYSMMGGPPG